MLWHSSLLPFSWKAFILCLCLSVLHLPDFCVFFVLIHLTLWSSALLCILCPISVSLAQFSCLYFWVPTPTSLSLISVLYLLALCHLSLLTIPDTSPLFPSPAFRSGSQIPVPLTCLFPGFLSALPPSFLVSQVP